MEELHKEVMANIRSVLISTKGAITLNQLQSDYYKLVGTHIPYQELGYDQLSLFLKNEPTLWTAWRKKDLYVDARQTQQTAHLAHLVANQKNSTTKGKKNKSKEADRVATSITPNLSNGRTTGKVFHSSSVWRPKAHFVQANTRNNMANDGKVPILAPNSMNGIPPLMSLSIPVADSIRSTATSLETDQCTERGNFDIEGSISSRQDSLHTVDTECTSTSQTEFYDHSLLPDTIVASDVNKINCPVDLTVENADLKGQLKQFQRLTQTLKTALFEKDLNCKRLQYKLIDMNSQLINEKINLAFDQSYSDVPSRDIRDLKHQIENVSAQNLKLMQDLCLTIQDYSWPSSEAPELSNSDLFNQKYNMVSLDRRISVKYATELSNLLLECATLNAYIESCRICAHHVGKHTPNQMDNASSSGDSHTYHQCNDNIVQRYYNKRPRIGMNYGIDHPNKKRRLHYNYLNI